VQLVGSRNQNARDIAYSVSSSIGSATVAQLVLPEHRSRSSLIFSNLSASQMFVEIGAGEATCAISGGVVTSVTVVNGGFNFTKPPIVEFLGGGSGGNSTFIGCGQPGYDAPGTQSPFGQGPGAVGSKPATAIAVLSGSSVASITVLDGGAGYVAAPFVLLRNDPNDPNGCADPALNSGGGIPVAAKTSLIINGTDCPTSPVAVFCATSGSATRFSCKWMP